MIGNNKQIWPGYIKPLEDELFSSWLIRLSNEHLIKSYSFSKIYFDNHPIWNRDIDKMIPFKIIQKLKKHTPLSDNEINELFLNSYSNYLFEGNINSSYTRGILNLGISHRKRHNYGLLACPICLSKNIPYFKRKWRLYTSLICLSCKCELIDRCLNCEKPIAFHRLELENKSSLNKSPLYICWYCKSDLRKYSKKVFKNSKKYFYQKFINETLCSGYNYITQYSFTYIHVLTYICTSLETKSNQWNRLQLALFDDSEYDLDEKLITNNPYQNSIKKRKKLLLNSFKLLNNWPLEFLRIRDKYNIRYSDFSKDMKNIPFWLFRVLKSS